MNLGALFEAYGQTAGPFFKGQADAEQVGADERRKNIESWLNQQQLKLSQQEADRRQQFGQQELGMRQEDLGLRQQELGLRTQQEQRREQQEALLAREADARAAALQFKMKNEIEDRARADAMRAEQEGVDWTDTEKAQKELQKIALKHADPATLLKYTYSPKQQEELAFIEDLPTYTARLNNLLENPAQAKFVPEYVAALKSKDRKEMARVEAKIMAQQQRDTAETDRKSTADARQYSLDQARKEHFAHWKAQENIEQERLNVMRGKINAVKPTDKNGAKDLQGYITSLQKDRAQLYSRLKAIDTALGVPTLAAEDAIKLRAEREEKQNLLGPNAQALSEAELKLHSNVFGTGTPAPTGAPAAGTPPPVVPPSPSSTPAAKPQGIRVPLPGGGEAIVTPH